MTELLVFLVGVFVFFAIMLLWERGEIKKKLIEMTNKEYKARSDVEYWKDAWEHIWKDYQRLTIRPTSDDDPYVYGDTGGEYWKITGTDSTP